ncbi:hypothetical protein EVAR_14248_1 [Eumeta japonica]|uniref:Uncharacterized protein n=1 Tax=Eumeta variegata TaxID=151549 RepID=A0A4C1WC63_EUMVA|nr:hypothetical protein EVAR_14248_1 [Eumeta japonica]
MLESSDFIQDPLGTSLRATPHIGGGTSEFYENYETLAALKSWTERQKKAGLTLYTAGPAKFRLKTNDTTVMTYDEIIKEI